MIERTERGWAGHFIGANNCRFRRNTLISNGDRRVVVSSVGLYEPAKEGRFEQIGHERYFETMVFYASYDGRYWDADVDKQITFNSPWCIGEVDADDKANDMHEVVVEEMTQRLLDEDFDWEAIEV